MEEWEKIGLAVCITVIIMALFSTILYMFFQDDLARSLTDNCKKTISQTSKEGVDAGFEKGVEIGTNAGVNKAINCLNQCISTGDQQNQCYSRNCIDNCIR